MLIFLWLTQYDMLIANIANIDNISNPMRWLFYILFLCYYAPLFRVTRFAQEILEAVKPFRIKLKCTCYPLLPGRHKQSQTMK